MTRPTYYIKTENRKQELALKALQTRGNKAQLIGVIKVATSLINALPLHHTEFSVDELLTTVVSMEVMLEQIKIIYTHNEGDRLEKIETLFLDGMEKRLQEGD